MLPIVEILASATCHAERAAWLLSAPTSSLYSACTDISRILRAAQFHAGDALLSIEVSAAVATRQNGQLPLELQQALAASRLKMVKVAGLGVRK